MTTLTFVASEERYSEYRARDGSEVYLAHGTAKRLVPFDDLDLRALWREFLLTNSAWNHDGFHELLRSLTIDEEVVDDVGFCNDCLAPDHEDDQNTVNGGNSVCDSCSSNYYFCYHCDERFRTTTTTLADDEVCRGCRDANYTFCDHCDGWYRDEDGADHQHAGQGCTCESPAQSFTIRNDGDEPLGNDTRATITLPAGVISDVGLQEIRDHLCTTARMMVIEERERYYNLSYRLSELGNTWQTRQGNYTKRLSRFAYKEFGIKLSPEIVSRVGCIARDHSTAVDFEIEVTRDLNLSPEQFCHEDSCWWQSYSASRCALKSNGGFGLRTFSDYYVSGRAWVMPLRETGRGGLTPTFETFEPDAFVVFNGYGNLEGYAPARIMSHMAGMTYRKITFQCGPMYVNNDSGYLVAPEEIADRYTDGSLTLNVDAHSRLFTNETKELINA